MQQMKFGKRLLAEAERRWLDFYVDYKALKHAIQADVDARGKLLYEMVAFTEKRTFNVL